MSIREAMNGKKSLGIGVGVVLIVLAGIFILSQLKQLMPPSQGSVYYTVDDPETSADFNQVFTAGTAELPPFDHNGKSAVRAHVFPCPGGKKVIGYLSKMTDPAKAALLEAKEAGKAGKTPANVGMLSSIGTTGTLVKKPGKDKSGKPYDWISMGDIVKATAIRVYKCDPKDTEAPEEIDP